MGQTRKNNTVMRSANKMSQTVASFGVESSDHLKDVFLALALSETVYRVLDPGGLQQAVHVADELCKGLPQFSDVDIKLQWSAPDLAHRYMLGETRDALYVAFMGTKQRRDIVSNARIGMASLWPNEVLTIQEGPQAHRGFLRRARAVDVHNLYMHASQKGLRLVLCGHSLGGAVAQICTVDLLKSLDVSSEAGTVPISCIGYATPAIGNASLASLVREKGWHSFFINYLLPEDVLGSFFGRHTKPPSGDISAAPKGMKLPADYSAVANVAAQKGSSSEQQTGKPEEEPLRLNNIMPCPHLHSEMVFREPLHLGLGPPLMRDLLSGARGEMSSVSLEMADTNPWLFRNDIHCASHCRAKAAAAGIALSSTCVSIAAVAQQSAPVLLKKVRSTETAREKRVNTPPDSSLREGGWFFPAGDMAERSGTRAAFHMDSSREKAGLLQAPSPAAVDVDSVEEEEGALLSPCISVSSSNSILSSLDHDMESILAAAEGNRAPDILRRARDLTSAFLLPVTMLAGYRPIGRQWRLAKPGQPADAPITELFADRLVSTLADGSAASAEQDPVLARDVSRLDALQRRLRTIFWMHRLPVYRARVREIYDSATGGGPASGNAHLKNRANQNRAWLADAVAPTMHAESARLIASSGTDWWNSAAVPQQSPVPRNAAGSVAKTQKGLLQITASLLIAVWQLLWQTLSLGWGWSAKLRVTASQGRKYNVFIAVHGRGLQHCSRAAVSIKGDAMLPAMVVQKPQWGVGEASRIQQTGPSSLLLASQNLAQAVDLNNPQLLLLSVQVPQAELPRLQLENSNSITLMSDFFTVVAALEPPRTNDIMP